MMRLEIARLPGTTKRRRWIISIGNKWLPASVLACWRSNDMASLKIAIIGAGSVGFTRTLVRDILCVPELQDIEFALTDLNEHNLGMVRQILDRVVAVNGLPTRITATMDRREALSGARYVINCVRVGGLDAFADDIRIPLQYG